MILDSAIFPSSGGGGSTATIWASGQTVAQWEWKISPADGELYQRLTASGGGTTDPADDITNYVARSYPRTVSISPYIPAIATSGTIAANNVFTGSQIITPSSTVGVRTRVVNITGRGVLKFCGFWHVQTFSRIRRFEIIVDGRTVYDTGSVTFPSTGHTVAIGGIAGAYDGTSFKNAYSALPAGALYYRRTLEIWSTKSVEDDTGTQLAIGTVVQTEA